MIDYDTRKRMGLRDEIPPNKMEKASTVLCYTLTFLITGALVAAIPYDIVQKRKYDNMDLQLFDKSFLGIPFTLLAPNKTLTVAISEKFTSAEQEEIKQAFDDVDFLAEGLHFECEVTNNYFGKKIIVKKNDTDRKFNGVTPYAYTETIKYGYTASILLPGTITINPGYTKSGKKLKSVALHEIGHIVGLKDVHDATLFYKTIMFWTPFLASESYTELDTKELNLVYPAREVEPTNSEFKYIVPSLNAKKKHIELKEDEYNFSL